MIFNLNPNQVSFFNMILKLLLRRDSSDKRVEKIYKISKFEFV